jgi:hypothetical protein
VRALEFCGDVAGTARQVHELVTTHSLFTLSSTAENCKFTRGRGGVTFCNLSNGPVTLKQGQVLAEWRPSTTVYVITTASGEVLQQPVDSANLDSIDTAGPGESLISVSDNVTTMDTRLLGATVGGEHLSQTQNERLQHQLLDSGAFDQQNSTQFTPLITCSIEIQLGSSPPTLNPYRAPQADRVVIDGPVAELLDTGRAVESKSAYSSPVHLVKKDGKFRLVVDCRRLNKVTVRQIWPAARIDNLLGARW